MLCQHIVMARIRYNQSSKNGFSFEFLSETAADGAEQESLLAVVDISTYNVSVEGW